LTPLQIFWCYYNILDDYEKQQKALKGESIEFKTDISDEEFKEEVKRMFRSKK